MRVLHVITALEVGGAEHMLLKLLGSRAMANIEHEVIAMLPGGALAEPMRAVGTAVRQLNFLGGLPLIAGALQLAREARRWGPDLVHGWLYHGNLGAALARAVQPRRIPLIWGIRQSLASTAGENALARLGIHANRLLSRLPDCLLFNSLASVEQHRAFGFHGERMQYLPNGFDTLSFCPDAAARARLRASWGVGDGDVVFGLLARYHPVKDHRGFLQAARLTLEARPRARFVLAGPGIDAANRELRGAIAELGLGGHVHLLGPRQDVAAVCSALDVYVSASRAEAFSNSVGEAMSCALPCVVTAVGDSPRLVGDCGLVAPPGDPAALARAMVALVDLGVPGRGALGARARLRIEADFGIEAVARRQADLYRQLVGAAGTAA